MEAFIARQPIFDETDRVHAYELLFRSGPENVFTGEDPDVATSRVLSDGALVFGLDELTSGRPAFVNVGRDFLLGGLVEALPPGRVVVEILESVRPDADVLAACRRLRRKGYVVALDDVVDADRCGALLDVADLAKVDFRGTTPQSRPELIRRLSGHGLQLLAEKVETVEEREEARSLGCDLFQGFYYGRPDLRRGRDVPAGKPRMLRLIRELQQDDLSFDRIEPILRHEPSLSYKLLRYVNSAVMALKHEVGTLRQAMALLGERRFRRWATLVAMACVGQDKPSELVSLAVTRARFDELLAPHAGLDGREDELFLMGLFSLLDAFVDRPLANALALVPLAGDVKAGLLGEDNPARRVHGCALAYESGAWPDLEVRAASLDLSRTELPRLYASALSFSQRVAGADAGGDVRGDSPAA